MSYSTLIEPRLHRLWLSLYAVAAGVSVAGCPGPVPAGRHGAGGASGSSASGTSIASNTSSTTSSGGLGPGAACAIGVDCASGFCSAGVCCDSACTGRCQTCVGSHLGTCGLVPSGETDPSGQCVPTACGSAVCDGDGGCQPAPDSTACGAVCLDAGVYQPPGACSNGACSTVPEACASGTTCSATGCATSCTSSSSCAGGLTCVDGACVPIVDAGGACTESMQCASGACVGGECCATACPAPAMGGSVQCQSSCANGGACVASTAPLGTSCTDNGGATCDGAGVCQPVKFVFATSAAYEGIVFNGALGADTTCRTVAAGVKFGGTWRAWISDSSTDVAARFTHPTAVSYNVIGSKGVGLGALVAPSASALYANQLMNGIDTSETGAPLASSPVWTGTGPDGHVSTLASDALATCTNWTSSGGQGVIGTLGATGTSWTASGMAGCGSSLHIYCFLQ